MKTINAKGERVVRLLQLLIKEVSEKEPKRLVVAFAPHRGFVKDLKLNGVSFKQVKRAKHQIWHGIVPPSSAKEVKLDVEQFGEPARIERQEFVAPKDKTEARAAVARATTELDDRMRELLQVRSQVKTRSSRLQLAQQFFLRFDAWTYPTVANLMREKQFRKKLGPDTRKFYCSKIKPRLAPLSTDMGAAMDDLFDLMRERPLRMLGPVNGQATAAAGTAAAGTASEVPAETLQRIDKIAAFLENLFDASFPPIESTGQVSPEFERAFAVFATGGLRHVNGDPESQPDLLNTEPNSANFLCFVEMCLRAIDRRPERREYWFSMARMFTALITPFCMNYADDDKPRNATNYLRTDRRSSRAVSAERAIKRINAARQRMPDSTKLAALERWVAAELLWALYDDLES